MGTLIWAPVTKAQAICSLYSKLHNNAPKKKNHECKKYNIANANMMLEYNLNPPTIKGANLEGDDSEQIATGSVRSQIPNQ